jgi:hypothetical protein
MTSKTRDTDNFNNLLSRMRVVNSNAPNVTDEYIPFPRDVDDSFLSDEEDEFAEAFGTDEEESEESEEDEAAMYEDPFGDAKPKRRAAKKAPAKKGKAQQQQQVFQPQVQSFQPQNFQPQVQSFQPQNFQQQPQNFQQQPQGFQPQQQVFQPQVLQSTRSPRLVIRQPTTQGLQPQIYATPTNVPALQPFQPLQNNQSQSQSVRQEPTYVTPIFQQGVNEPNDIFQLRMQLTQRIQARFPTIDGPTLITLGELLINSIQYGVVYDADIQHTITSVISQI